jgi:hypothetical protein
MAENKNQENNPSSHRKANPSDTGKDKASIKKGGTSEELKKEEKITEKYTDEGGEIPSHLKKGANPNRNTDKPDIDKPAYGSSK